MMKCLLVPEDFPSGNPDFQMMMERYPKALLHYARLVPAGDNFAAQVIASRQAHIFFRLGMQSGQCHCPELPDLQYIEV